jgi:hypothetical protein
MIRVVLLLVFLSSKGVHAADGLYVCPGEITAGWNVSPAPQGWETFGATTVQHHRLSGATFANGHPKGQGFLKPFTAGTSRAVKKGLRQDVYQFSAKYPEGIWLVCRYHNTPAIVFKRLPDVPKICEVSYAVNPARSPIETISCR